MDKHELIKFAQLMAATGVIHDKDLPEAAIELYWQSLKQYPFAAVAQALQAHRDNPDGGQFMPKPADIIRLMTGSGQNRASSAWAKVEKAIAEVGGYESVVFDDLLIHAVLEEMGGWIRLCQTSTAQLKFSSSKFKRLYELLLLHPPFCCHQKTLKGRVEAHNASDGYKSPPPVMIGDERQAHLVMTSGGGRAPSAYCPNRPLITATPQTKYLPQEMRP